MPCTYVESAEEIRIRLQKENARVIAPYKHETDKVTRLLCSVMTNLEDDLISSLKRKVPGLSEWWKDHQAKDAAKKTK